MEESSSGCCLGCLGTIGSVIAGIFGIIWGIIKFGFELIWRFISWFVGGTWDAIVNFFKSLGNGAIMLNDSANATFGLPLVVVLLLIGAAIALFFYIRKLYRKNLSSRIQLKVQPLIEQGETAEAAGDDLTAAKAYEKVWLIYESHRESLGNYRPPVSPYHYQAKYKQCMARPIFKKNGNNPFISLFLEMGRRWATRRLGSARRSA